MNSLYMGSKKNGDNSINWLKWDKTTTCMDFGGLNFRDLEGFNLTMLRKHGWKLLTNSSSLLTILLIIVLKAKHFPRSGFWMPKLTIVQVSHGVSDVSGALFISHPLVIDEKYVTVIISVSGMINGFAKGKILSF
jgi:hypothetical protein